MSRNIPIQTVTALAENASTFTRLLRITLTNGISYGLCMSNRDVTYDHGDGTGSMNYSSTNGFDPSTFSSSIDYSVDNAEGYAMVSEDIPGVTVEMVQAGVMNDAQWICYYVDYLNPTAGSAVVLDAGDVGTATTQYGMVWIPELLSYAMRLRQPIGGTYSRTCRAIFGTPADSQTGCGIDVTGLWIAGTVTSVGAETDRTFTASALVPGAYPLFPGRVQFLTGANAGGLYAVESYATGGVVTLNETTVYPIADGDTFQIRPDCDLTEANCNIYGNYLNMKAEPRIPVGDTAAIASPGAQL